MQDSEPLTTTLWRPQDSSSAGALCCQGREQNFQKILSKPSDDAELSFQS